jgi:hypothetical protein
MPGTSRSWAATAGTTGATWAAAKDMVSGMAKGMAEVMAAGCALPPGLYKCPWGCHRMAPKKLRNTTNGKFQGGIGTPRTKPPTVSPWKSWGQVIGKNGGC